jgi:hypothetical protein
MSSTFNVKKHWDQNKESKKSDNKTTDNSNLEEAAEKSLKKFRRSFRFSLFGKEHAQRNPLTNSNSGHMQISTFFPSKNETFHSSLMFLEHPLYKWKRTGKAFKRNFKNGKV